MTESLDPLSVELPVAYRSADEVSGRGQSSMRLYVGGELLLAVLGAIGGVVSWTAVGLNLAGGLAVIGFAGALAVGLLRTKTKPEHQWYDGRAAAESIKTLAWRYAVRGDPFPDGLSSDQCRQEFLKRIEAIVKALPNLELQGASSNAAQLTPSMEALRCENLARRMNAYRTDRIGNQVDWYNLRARRHARSAREWSFVVAVTNVAGILLGLARLVNRLEVDVFGIAATVVGGATAWVQMNQHRSLAVSYSVTAQELLIVRDRIEGVSSETKWATFVSDAEDAISREHTLWLASHGHPEPSA